VQGHKGTVIPQRQPSKIYHFFISRDEPRLRAGWRLLIHGLLLIFLTMIFAFIISIILLILRAKLSANAEGIPKYAEILISLPSILLATFIARSVLDHRTFQSMGLKINRRMTLDLMVGFMIPLFIIGLIFLLEWGFGWLQIKTTSWRASPNSDWILSLLGSLGYFIVIGFQEELIFRGYQLHNLIEGLDFTKGLILSSAFFALAHIFNPHTSLLSTLGIFISGLFLAYGWIRTHQLWLPIGLHMGWNFFEGVIFGFPVSGTDTFRLISHTVSGPEVLTGGSFGPEAGLILLPALVVGFGLIWIYTKSRVSTQEESSLADSLFGPHIHG
jgi:membrane protease YdiL (CAAX protease family)